MFTTHDIHPLTDFQRNAKDHVKRLKDTKRPEILTVNGKPSLVIQDAVAYEAMVDLLDSLKHIQIAAEAFNKGEGRPVNEFFVEFEKKHGLSGSYRVLYRIKKDVVQLLHVRGGGQEHKL